MTIHLNSSDVWQAVKKELFAVLGMVTPQNEARTVGIVYIEDNHKLYIGTGKRAWKTRHIIRNSAVSLTIPIAKRIALLPWIKIPAATITFSGTARVLEPEETPPAILQALLRDVASNEKELADSCVIEVTPRGDFITYGVGIPLLQMRYPDKARGRAPVNGVIDEILT